MTIRIYNSLGRKKENFESIEAGKVKMYVCGPTAYDSCHIGHARSVVVFDVIARYFREKNYSVIYVRNFTDVDDKIINRANQLGISASELAEKYIKEFYKDMDALNVVRADYEPRATQFVGQMIQVIEVLIKKGLAYQINGATLRWKNLMATENFPDDAWKEWRRAPGWISTKKNIIPSILPCGNLQNRENQPGKARGARGVRGGISNVRP